ILPELVGVEDPRITVTASRREKWLPIETIRFVVADEHLLASLPMRVALKKQTLRKFGYNPEELIEEITTSYRVTPNVQ
ncbi:MAG: hypothetical protein N2037_14680, partial [Acidimicrobiales bacterium]|nr:hypothetical protein [Acidimicrobiales bacterium]